MYPCIKVLLVFLVLEVKVYIKRNKITDLSFYLYFGFCLNFCKILLQFGAPSLRDSGPLTMVEVSQTSNLAPLQFILNINIPPGNAWFNVSHIIAFSCQCSILFLSEVTFYCTILGDNDSSHQHLRYWIIKIMVVAWNVRGLQQLSVRSVALGEKGTQCVQKNETNTLLQKRHRENAQYYVYIWILGTPWILNLCLNCVTCILKLNFLAISFKQEFCKFF